MATIKQLVGITAQYNEIFKRVGNGSLDPDAVKRAFQRIIEGTLPFMINPPAWWRSPEQQLEKACQLWPNITPPSPPANFIPRTNTEVLLLHVPRSFDELWDAIVAPDGYTVWRWDDSMKDGNHLQLAPNVPNRTEPVWLAFDPEHGRGGRPESFWGQSNLAASEVLSAIIQFPNWSLSWFNGASAPVLGGYQFRDSRWSVPFICRWDETRQLRLYDYCAANADDDLALPAVREC